MNTRFFKMMVPMVAALILTASCTKEYITYGSQVRTHEYEITPSQWMRNEGNNLPGSDNYLYAEFANADITADVMNGGGTVQAFVYNIYNVAENLGSWNTLPFVYPLEVVVFNEETLQNETIIVPENMRFEWENGKVTFIIQDLDGYDPEDMVSTIHVKVSVTKNMR